MKKDKKERISFFFILNDSRGCVWVEGGNLDKLEQQLKGGKKKRKRERRRRRKSERDKRLV